MKGVAVWDLVVDDSLDIYRLQLELYGNINQPVLKEKENKQMNTKTSNF